jgi:hypothetical protein
MRRLSLLAEDGSNSLQWWVGPSRARLGGQRNDFRWIAIVPRRGGTRLVEPVNRIRIPSTRGSSIRSTRGRGERLRIRERRARPPPTYYLTTAEGEGFAVPVWMTTEAAADVRYEERPHLDLRALVQIAGLTEKGLESAEPREEVLPSDQAKETLHGDQPTPADTDSRRSSSRAGTACRDSSGKHRARSADAARARSRRAGKRQVEGGAR